jgi:regulator of replication initiation timing
MYTFYIDHLRRRYYGQIDLNHQNFINETNGDGLAHTIIRRLQHGNKWPDNEARTYQMLYLLAAMNPASFNIRNKIGTLRGDTPLELIHQFPNFASPRLVNLLQHPVETHSDLFSLKLCIGVLQESVNRLGMENDSLKTKLADTKTIETELKTELNDVKGQLTLLAELLNQRFNLEEPKSNSQLQNN